MKKNKSGMKAFLSIIISVAIMITGFFNVKAASDTIQLGQATKTGDYIAGVSFYYKVTDKGQYLYCLNMHKNTATNVKATMVRNSKNITGGLVYILKNGYPNKTITGDKAKDYYITQTAVWWYLDMTTGSSNLGEQFKENGSDPHNLRQYVKQLATEGYNHRNDAIGIADTKLAISSTDSHLVLQNGYYTSGDIKANTVKNISTYTVTLEGVPTGTKIVKNGTESDYTKAFAMNANESFKIKVPAANVKTTNLSIKVKATAKGNASYMAYEYQPADASMQNVALLEKDEKEVSSELKLEISSSKVTIIKVDSNTKQPLAGAKLVLKDANGKVLANWESKTSAHVIRNLANGNYTIEETAAPTGYAINKNITKFTITDTNRDIKITIENAPKKVVVNIIKVDQATNSPLAGAVLLVRNAKGEEIARFTTTLTPYILTDLADGTYTVEEVSAPAGYIRSTNKLTFTIDDAHQSHQVTFVNAKETIVPNTSTASTTLLYVLGASIMGAGILFIRKNGKRA